MAGMIAYAHRAHRTLLQDDEPTVEGNAEAIGDLTAAIDTQLLLTSGYLVFFMQCGFAMLSAGSVRAKNAKNIVLKNLLDACFGGLGWYLTGYAFAYGNGGPFIGGSNFALSDLSSLQSGDRGVDLATWFFQYTFTATAATIVSGAVAERCKFEAYLCYALFLSMWVYPVVVRWVWAGQGWATAFKEDPEDLLFGTGVFDFAGCGVVHMTGGFAAFAGAKILGPRLGRFNSKGEPQDLPGHNTSLALLGVFILWFGWFGFNPGSALALTGGFYQVAANCAVTTTLSAAGGTMSALAGAMFMEYLKTGHMVWDLILASNGTLGGLVGITSSCAFVSPWGAFFIGIISGLVYLFGSWFVLNIAKTDDPLDAVAVHGFCGMWGLLAAGIFPVDQLVKFAYEVGPDYSQGKLFGAQLVVLIVIACWVLVHMFPFFFVMKQLNLFRVSAEEEHEGLDVSHHGGSAYPTDAVTKMGGEGGAFASADEVAALKRQLRDIEMKVFNEAS